MPPMKLVTKQVYNTTLVHLLLNHFVLETRASLLVGHDEILETATMKIQIIIVSQVRF